MHTSAIHMAVIRYFAQKYGRNWKSRLNSMWWAGVDVKERHGALLRQIRNEHGPAWLASYRLDGDPGLICQTQVDGVSSVQRVAENLGAKLSDWEQSKAVEWKYTNLTLEDDTFRVGVSTGGVMAINGSPHSDGSVILSNHLFELEILLRLTSKKRCQGL